MSIQNIYKKGESVYDAYDNDNTNNDVSSLYKNTPKPFEHNPLAWITDSKVYKSMYKKPNEVADNNIQYIYKGIAKRAFEQKFRLEQFVEVKDAKLSDGLLTISLKREIPEERKPKKIPLKVA